MNRDFCIHRRQLFGQLTAFGVGLCWSNDLFSMGKDSLLRLGLLDGLSDAVDRESGIEKLMWEATKRTSMRTQETPRRLRLENGDLYQCPLIIWSGFGEAKALTETQSGRLRHFLKLGGTLFVDDASPMGDNRFDQSFRKVLKTIWTDGELTAFGRDHTFYRTFYLLSGSKGRIDRDKRLYGVDFEDRSPIIYSRNDLLGALSREPSGEWALPVRPGGARQREMALRFGLNLLMYATCLNYKRDQVHVPAILKRRKWRTGN